MVVVAAIFSIDSFKSSVCFHFQSCAREKQCRPSRSSFSFDDDNSTFFFEFFGLMNRKCPHELGWPFFFCVLVLVFGWSMFLIFILQTKWKFPRMIVNELCTSLTDIICLFVDFKFGRCCCLFNSLFVGLTTWTQVRICACVWLVSLFFSDLYHKYNL